MCGMYSDYNTHSIIMAMGLLEIFSFVATVVNPNPRESTQYEAGSASGSSNMNGIFITLIKMVL